MQPHLDFYIGAVSEAFRDDVKGIAFTLYEIITGDLQHPLTHDSKVSDVLDRECIAHPDVAFDRDFQDHREALWRWVEWRGQPGNVSEHYKKAAEHIDWPVPFIPVLPDKDAHGNILRMRPYFVARRSGWKSLGVDIVEWKRPAYNKIPDGFYVLGNGELVPRLEIG